MANVLITGCGGFVGRVLAKRLQGAGHDVWGIDRIGTQTGLAGARCVAGDLTDPAVVIDLLDRTSPDWIVHLAAQSSVRKSFDEPYATIVNNTLPTLNLLNDLKASGRPVRLLVVGSADEYGVVAEDQLPIREDAPVNPESPYALGKSIQNQCCLGFSSLYGLNVIVTRSFNHTGAGQSDAFVLPGFAKQVAGIKLGQCEPVMRVGNLDVRRDFTDVRDVCDAYVALLEQGAPGETYNVCSGVSHSIRALLNQLCELAGIEVELKVDPDRLRPVDMPDLRGDGSKIREATGWSPSIPIADTLQSLLDYWIEHLSARENTNTGQ